MAKNGLDKWFKQKWVDIGSKRKDGSFAPCGRSKQKKDAKRKYPKCVPLAKATRMTKGERASAVKRKRAVAQGVGGKPTNVKTFTRKKKNMGGSAGENSMVKQAQRNYIGSYVQGDLGGVKVGNKSLQKFYSNPGFRMPKIS
jgi:hypothetical protein